MRPRVPFDSIAPSKNTLPRHLATVARMSVDDKNKITEPIHCLPIMQLGVADKFRF